LKRISSPGVKSPRWIYKVNDQRNLGVIDDPHRRRLRRQPLAPPQRSQVLSANPHRHQRRNLRRRLLLRQPLLIARENLLLPRLPGNPRINDRPQVTGHDLTVGHLALDPRPHRREAFALQENTTIANDDLLSLGLQTERPLDVQRQRGRQRIKALELPRIAVQENQLDLDPPRRQSAHPPRLQHRRALGLEHRAHRVIRLLVDVLRLHELNDAKQADEGIIRRLDLTPGQRLEHKVQLRNLNGLTLAHRRWPEDFESQSLANIEVTWLINKRDIEGDVEIAALTKPDRVYWCDGSSGRIREALLELIARPARSSASTRRQAPQLLLRRLRPPKDVARVESRTFICSRDKADAGPTNNWATPRKCAPSSRLFDGCMRGRTMYVVPFCMGPLGSPISQLGVEITDSVTSPSRCAS
jgi:hypothetical protein